MNSHQIVFATNNLHKINEVRDILHQWNILSLKDLGLSIKIPEDYQTIEENAIQKAKYVFNIVQRPVISDDSGLEIEALDGRPGVVSAFYAGQDCSDEDNIRKVLQELHGIRNRSARFRTIAVYYDGSSIDMSEGVLRGNIALEPAGHNGFGYDPIFIPEGFNITLAQMSPELKNQISHRAIAFRNLAQILNKMIHEKQ